MKTETTITTEMITTIIITITTTIITTKKITIDSFNTKLKSFPLKGSFFKH